MAKKKDYDAEITPDGNPINGINWYPGHMARALREIKEKMKMVDIVLEIRDARAPMASGNNNLDELLKQKSRLILFNKANLAEPNAVKLWEEYYRKQEVPFIFLDCFDKTEMKKALKLAHEITHQKRVESNPEGQELVKKTKLKMMIIGLPNTGKSTIINMLAGRSATKVADRPGQTQVQQWIKLEDELELLDTPGVMPPYFIREEQGLWLSAIHALPEEVVGPEQTAIFLINYFKEKDSKTFKDRYKLENFDGALDNILLKIATVRGCVRQKGLPDLERVFKLILLEFRKGELGKVCFGLPPKEK